MNQPLMQRERVPVQDTELSMYVTMRINQQLFGVEVRHVRDVLIQQKVTPVPLAPPEVAGSLNLRGRIVTVIDLRKRLGLPDDPMPGNKPKKSGSTFVVVDLKGELYSLMVDSVSEVLTTEAHRIEKTPANIDPSWKDIAAGIYKMDNELLVLVDIKTLLSI